MGSLMNGSLSGQEIIPQANRLSILSLVVNRLCNLRCRYCYLVDESQTEVADLAHENWLRLVSTALDEKVEALCFSGKEIFANSNSAEIMFKAVEERNSSAAFVSTKIGVITNGTLLNRYREKLTEYRPDWLDVSIDGLPTIHNEHRGNNSFEKVEKNLPWLIDIFANELWACLTVTRENHLVLAESIAFLNRQFGLQSFAIGVYKPQEYTDRALAMDQAQKRYLVNELEKLQQIDVKNPIRVFVQADMGENDLVRALRDAGYASNESFITKRTVYANGVTIIAEATDKRKAASYSARVTYDGYILAAEDVADNENRVTNAVGHVSEIGFDVRNIQKLSSRNECVKALV